MNNSIIKSDFLVIGSGIAGLTYALKLSEYGKVTVICKSSPTEGSTRYAQGGIASVTSPLDSFESHIKDTLICGAGLCDREIVELVIREGPECVENLITLGANFDKQGENYSLGKEGGHSERRILHAGDSTGAEIQRALYEKANNKSNIKIYSHHVGIDLILNKDNETIGVYALDTANSEVKSFIARSTLIAAGGAGTVYLYTSNPVVATGDGIAMAYRAGAIISNMEFIQFHPTCLYHPKARSFLLTEALRGEGAILKRIDGTSFMQHYHEKKELAPRDIVARAIDDQMKQTGDDYVLLDLRHLGEDFLKKRFPNIYETLNSLGLNPALEAIPVVPAAHYCCGGIKTDCNGLTNIRGLYAAGECAYTGLHGANRLASNSLLEALVFAARAAKHTIENLKNDQLTDDCPTWDHMETTKSKEEVVVSHAWDEVRRTMWNLVGIVRSNRRLKLAQKRIQLISEEIKDYYWKFRVTKDLLELRNIITIAELIIKSALQRKESRGLHYNTDYPKESEELKITNLKKH